MSNIVEELERSVSTSCPSPITHHPSPIIHHPSSIIHHSVFQPNLIPRIVDKKESAFAAFDRADDEARVIRLNGFEIVDLFCGIASSLGLLVETGIKRRNACVRNF